MFVVWIIGLVGISVDVSGLFKDVDVLLLIGIVLFVLVFLLVIYCLLILVLIFLIVVGFVYLVIMLIFGLFVKEGIIIYGL